jgi:hypothetical protein
MFLFWRIRYLDSRDKEYKNRDLWLDTCELDPATKAAIEACCELERLGGGRGMLKYRHLFHTEKLSASEMNAKATRCGGTAWASLPDYFEDENGKELTYKEMAVALSGNPDAEMYPPGTRRHDVELMRSPKPKLDLKQVKLAASDLTALEYFCRDFHEMKASAFLVEGPGSFTPHGPQGLMVQTAVSDDEIRSFITIFRRLYMMGEPGSFLKAVEILARTLPSHPMVRWIVAEAAEYGKDLEESPPPVHFGQSTKLTFTRKRVIDVHLYTQYAHQGDERRERQYAECLAQVNGQLAALFWLFLWSLREIAGHIYNAGWYIAAFVEQYREAHGLVPSTVETASGYIAMGELEKKADRKARILREKAEELSLKLWQTNGRPEGGPMQFLHQANEQLRAVMGESAGLEERE